MSLDEIRLRSLDEVRPDKLWIPGAKSVAPRTASSEIELLHRRSKAAATNLPPIQAAIRRITELPRTLIEAKTEELDFNYRNGIEPEDVIRNDRYNHYHYPRYTDEVQLPIKNRRLKILTGGHLVHSDLAQERELQRLDYWETSWSAEGRPGYNTQFNFKYYVNGLHQTTNESVRFDFQDIKDAPFHNNGGNYPNHLFWYFTSFYDYMRDQTPEKLHFYWNSSKIDFTNNFIPTSATLLRDFIKDTPPGSYELRVSFGEKPKIYIHPYQFSGFTMGYEFNPDSGNLERFLGNNQHKYLSQSDIAYVKKSLLFSSESLKIADFNDLLTSMVELVPGMPKPAEYIQPKLPF